jgi:hypothetical protein
MRLTHMPASDVPYVWQIPTRLHGADDAYSAWSNAHRRRTDALRAWDAARPADAYHVYAATLDHDEVAAAELARLHACAG